MYLKKVEFIGFKSFAERTVMNFLPGMTSIVGPNGCGKSNIADAVRWVLGEQSAKALRGGKMQDVIFNGAEGFKPTNMSEVSLTLSECEDVLPMDYHEVTITRRLFRSGESEYYLNKQPCRLRDIHRLFMDTGVGRNSYSILEQGKIDQVLSSRPEDRRLVFEEASGITKFKADRREALRKLEHTEQNLLRLDDVVREVKRRMISLQRQAGKARRYQEIQQRLQGRELWLSRHRMEEMSEAISDKEKRMEVLQEELTVSRADVATREGAIAEAREVLESADRVIADRMEAAVNLRNQLHQLKESVRVNGERIEEMKAYANRDHKDAEEARARLEQHHRTLAECEEALKKVRQAGGEEEALLQQRQQAVQALETSNAELRQTLRSLRTELEEQEQAAAKAQSSIREFEERERSRLVHQERLREGIREQEEAEAGRTERVQQLTSEVEAVNTRQRELQSRVDRAVAQQQQQGQSLTEQRAKLNEREQEVAGLKARLDVLHAQARDQEQFPAGARTLLSGEPLAGVDASRLVGALAEQVRTEPACQMALESLLRHWMDAVVVQDTAGLSTVFDALTSGEPEAVRVLAVQGIAPVSAAAEGPGEAFAPKVQTSPELRPLMDRLFAGVRLVSSFDQVPPPQPGQVWVTREGHILRGDGSLEVFSAEQEQGNPLALQAKITKTREALTRAEEESAHLRGSLEATQGEESRLREALKKDREDLQEISRRHAGLESELRSATLELEQGQARHRQLTNQLAPLTETHSESDEQRRSFVEALESARARQEEIKAVIEDHTKSFEAAEGERNTALQVATEQRIKCAEHRQKVESLERQHHNLTERIRELEGTVRDRNDGVMSHTERVEALQQACEEAKEKIPPLEEQLKERTAEIESEREQRQQRQTEVHQLEQALKAARQAVEAKSGESSRIDVDLAQRRVRLENLVQRVTETYQMGAQDIYRVEEPDWEQETPPGWDELEEAVNAMKAKLESMGPVNMVAIEEYQEQEDRYQFLMTQQEDLVQAKQKLLETIEQINSTTTEMFNTTFEKVNSHFQDMFKKLFGGGEAYLELVDAENVLESGIDIVAKPPGKKPQVISLLSGGERTMTAVALLFALYTVKPSPFCILDELDAALDDANIGRFVALVQSFLKDSQFIVITHNQKTIAAADVLYGITQERKGVSKVVSVKLTDHAAGEEPEAEPELAGV
jgi:chromosome segregation protein